MFVDLVAHRRSLGLCTKAPVPCTRTRALGLAIYSIFLDALPKNREKYVT